MDPTSPAQPAPPSEKTAAQVDMAEQIDELMAQPVKGLPKVIVVGDDAVSGFNPAPQPPRSDV